MQWFFRIDKVKDRMPTKFAGQLYSLPSVKSIGFLIFFILQENTTCCVVSKSADPALFHAKKRPKVIVKNGLKGSQKVHQ